MKKILFALMAVVLCVGLIGGAFAYFTDTQTSSNNVFAAGDVKLFLSNDGTNFYSTPPGNVVIGNTTSMAPGHDSGPYTVYFKNEGSIGGLVTAKVSYNNTTMGDAFAQMLIVDQAYSNLNGNALAANVAGYWAEQIVDKNAVSWVTAVGNGWVVADGTSVTGFYPTIYGLQTITLAFTNGYNGPSVTLDPNAVQWDQMYIKLASSADNTYEDFGITIAVTATLTSN